MNTRRRSATATTVFAAALTALVSVAATERMARAEDTPDSEDHGLPLETHFDEAPAPAPAPVTAVAPPAPVVAAPPVNEAVAAPPPAPPPPSVPVAHVTPAPAEPVQEDATPATPAPMAAFQLQPFGASSAPQDGEKPVHASSDSPSAWHFALGVDTDAPLDVAGRLALETPGRIRLSTALGTTPQAYANAVDGILRSVNAYDAGTSALFRAGFGKSLVWRTHIGIRPFENHGFYADAGYALVHLGGSTTAGAVASAAGEGAYSSYAGDGSYQLSTTVQMVDAEIGWEWPLVQGFRLRTALGGAFTINSSTSITAPSGGDSSLVASAGKQVDQSFEKYGFLPVLTVGLDYRLF